MLAYTGLGSFVTGLTSSQYWLNSAVEAALYVGGLNTPPLKITATPTTVIAGQIYLVGGSALSPLTPGTCIVYLTTSATSAVTVNPPVGTKVGAYVKTAADWVQDAVTNGGFYLTAASALSIPDDFRGSFHYYSAVPSVITPAGGKTPVGLTSLLLSANTTYHVYQNSNTLLVTT